MTTTRRQAPERPTRRAPHMEKYVRIGKPWHDAQVHLVVGNQSFLVNEPCESPEHALWMSDMLCIALDKMVSDLLPASVGGDGWSAAINDIAAERRRQIEAEGWTSEHDDGYPEDELPRAAAAYALGKHTLENLKGNKIRIWPWDLEWWKPTNRRRDLVKAGALILAEIERLDRQAHTPPGEKS